jgi:oligopeptidase A
MHQNPLLICKGIPLFEEITADHVVPAVETLLCELEVELTALESTATPTWGGVMEPLATLGERLGWLWGTVGHLMSVKNSPELREAYQQVEPQVIAFSLRISQSTAIFEAMQTLRSSPEWETLEDAQKRILEVALTDATLAGIGLEGPAKERFAQIANEIGELSTTFGNNVLDATKEFKLVLTDSSEVAGLPSTLLNTLAARARENGHPQASPETGPWCVTLDAATLAPFLKYSEREDLRKQVYLAYVSRASSGEQDNRPIIRRILELRKEKANLLGYSNYAEVSLARKMANTPNEVGSFLEDLLQQGYPAAQQELKELISFVESQDEAFRTSPEPHQLPAWSIGYWVEKLTMQQFQLSDEILRPYFALPNVLQGLFGLLGRIFDVTVVPADGEAQVWHPDVRFFKVMDPQGTILAYFFLDQYSRPGSKRDGAWMGDCLGRKRQADGSLQIPIAYLICNATPPAGNTPSLMTFSEVVTLFHETGHGLQHMLTKIDYPDAAGINGVEWDAVELPSQFMENWCYERSTLYSMAKHHETGEPLPEQLYQNLLRARDFRPGSQLARQLRFGLMDYTLHTSFDPTGSVSLREVEEEVYRRTSVLPLLPEDNLLCSFSHVFNGGYAFGYYSYLWADVLSADAFAAFEEAGLDQAQEIRSLGHKFRDTVLGLGGSQHPLKVFELFRGRPPEKEPFLRKKGLL